MHTKCWIYLSRSVADPGSGDFLHRNTRALPQWLAYCRYSLLYHYKLTVLNSLVLGTKTTVNLCSVLRRRNYFFGSGSYFSVGFWSGSGSFMNFSNILDINFTFVGYSCSLWRDIKLFRGIFLNKEELIYLNWAFLLRNLPDLLVLLQIHFGSGAARIRIRNDLSGSGSC